VLVGAHEIDDDGLLLPALEAVDRADLEARGALGAEQLAQPARLGRIGGDDRDLGRRQPAR